jgi:hypothetical protein
MDKPAHSTSLGLSRIATTLQTIECQVGLQPGDIARQTLEDVNMGGTDVAGWLKILRRPQGIKVGIAAPMAFG